MFRIINYPNVCLSIYTYISLSIYIYFSIYLTLLKDNPPPHNTNFYLFYDKKGKEKVKGQYSTKDN